MRIKVKRIIVKHRYVDRITIKRDGDRYRTYYQVWVPRQDRNTYYREYYQVSKPNYVNLTPLRSSKARQKIHRHAGKSIREKKEPRVVKPKVVPSTFSSSIVMAMVVSYRGGTPFNYPPRGGTTTYYRPRRTSEDGMIRIILGLDNPASYEEFRGWVQRHKTDRNVRIYGGWSYSLYGSNAQGFSKLLRFSKHTFNGRSHTISRRFPSS